MSWYEQRRFQVLLAALALMFALDAVIGAEARRHYAGGALFLFYALGMILATILREHEITVDTISGAVCGYLLLGLGCGWLYALVETLSPGSFFTARQDFLAWLANDRLRRSVLAYYSFVTLSTAGFGDITPVSQPARTLSWIEAVAGQFYMAILVAGLVGIRISQLAISPAPNRKTTPDSGNRDTAAVQPR